MQSSLTILPDPPPPPAPIGLIAGGGQLPLFIADGLRKQGYTVHAVGLHRQYDPALPERCDSFKDVGLLRVASWGRSLRRRGVRHAIMVGKVDKANLMHERFRVFKNIPDLTTAIVWYRKLRHDRRSHAVLKVVADELDRKGVQLIDSTIPIPDQLSSPGVMTRTQPSPEQRADIELVWPMLAELLRLDIGQSLTVRDRDVISVEAVEGTDRMIERTGDLCKRGGWTLVKGARAQHDRRSDVPTVGIRTIEHMHRHGGRCLAIAAEDVIMLDRENMIKRADELGLAIIGVPMAHATAVSRMVDKVQAIEPKTKTDTSNDIASDPSSSPTPPQAVR
ncbi:MAG: LpxI family protein [Phycisphaerales bacterium]